MIGRDGFDVMIFGSAKAKEVIIRFTDFATSTWWTI